MNVLQYTLGRATPGTPASKIFNFFKFPKPLRVCLQLVKVSSQSDERCVLLVWEHRVLQPVQFFIFLNFQNHRVTEGHISLTAVIRIWSWSPIYTQYSWWAKTLRDGHGNRVRGGRASGNRGMTSPPAIHGCTWFLGTRLTPPFRSYTLHVTWTIGLELASLWTGLLGLRASSWSACHTRGMCLGLHTRSCGRLPLDCWKINPVTMFYTADSFLFLTWTGWWTMKLEGNDHSVEFQP